MPDATPPDPPGSGTTPAVQNDTPQVDAGPPAPPPGGTVGGFRLVREIGRGGMGVVYEAEDPHLARRVAVKVMARDLTADPTARERFLREARTLAAVDHEHVVPVYAAGEDDGRPFLAMPLLPGRNLDARLADPVGVPEAVGFAVQIAAALAAAHARGLVHRDVKPSNVWLETHPDGTFRRVRLLDFGLTRSVSGGDIVTQPGATPGTPAFMAPEQAAGTPVDHRADLFSLGGVLYRMAAGRNPFTGPTPWAVLIAVARDTPPPAADLNPGVPASLSDLISRLLEKDPDRRPPTAAAVAAELDAILAELTRPPDPPQPPRPRPSRRPGHAVTVVLPPVTTTRLFGLTTAEYAPEVEMRWVPPGTFRMGSPTGEAHRNPDETPHDVTLTRGFFIGAHPVTVGQFRSFVQATGYETQAERHEDGSRWAGGGWKTDKQTNWRAPGFAQADDHPVTCVAWIDAVKFCEWLSDEAGRPARLPTEAEWEYACRAGTTTAFWFGDAITADRANYDATGTYGGPTGAFRERTTAVGAFAANPWGLHDTHGNVWEWCGDEYGPYTADPAVDPVGRYLDKSRVLRGGSWAHRPTNGRSAKRISVESTDYIGADKRSPGQKAAARARQGSDRCSCVGFRVVLEDN